MQSVQGSGINRTADGNLTQSFKVGSLARMYDLEDYNLLFWPSKLSFYRELILNHCFTQKSIHGPWKEKAGHYRS